MQRLRGGVRRDDRGGIAVLACVLLAGGVLLGMAALTLDVGQVYAEREELQSGADAAAVAVAERCVLRPDTCGPAPSGTAERYADANAKDGAAAVEVVCGARPGPLPACPPPAENLTACLGDPPVTGGYAEVRTRTRLPDGSKLLPPILAGTLLGEEDYAGAVVRACARAAWGPPQRARGLGLTVSLCEWRDATSGGTVFGPPPPAVPDASAEIVLKLHTTTAGHCPAGPSGGDTPGGFGWLDDPDDDCTTLVDTDGTYGGDPGVAISQACKDAFTDLYEDKRLTFLPIFESVTGTGQNTRYAIAGFAPFVITGYGLPGLDEPSWLTKKAHCSGSDKCVYGYFTRALMPGKGKIAGTDLGAAIVTLIG